MGNLVSCSARKGRKAAAARVILPGGEIRRLREPVKAAEIMLEHPTHFLVNAGSLTAGRRFSPLSADQDLESGNVYAAFPMKRLSSVITAADVAVLLVAAKKSPAKRLSAGNAAKVSPAEGGDETPGNDVGRLGVTSGFVGQEYRHRLSLCRSKKPLLETIIEEPVRTRVRLL
ncbi:PREDICTED: uncharacterized protein LOC109160832 [Ipomoea nil]|uniref:uncharacterized protein LOC109160832 n=1 Tax=Ipomoea nil TaxID=35883 RepID=UPI000901E477|nr:PREDICTED: uncharacterized protein LOC109160832 [Ipomoea nil]